MSALQEQLQNYFRTKPVLKAYLFGSAARNELNETSDLDIMIEFEPTIPIGLEFVEIYLDLKKITGREVDLVTPSSISKYIKPRVDREKVLVYERIA